MQGNIDARIETWRFLPAERSAGGSRFCCEKAFEKVFLLWASMGKRIVGMWAMC